MADGADRIFGYLVSAVERTHPGELCEFGVSASSGPSIAVGLVYDGDNPDTDGCISVADIKYSSEGNKCTSAQISFNPERVDIDSVVIWAQAVLEGAGSKGFPADDWNY